MKYLVVKRERGSAASMQLEIVGCFPMIEWFHSQNEYERTMSHYDFERLQERLGMYIVILLGISILVVLPLCIWSIKKWCCKVRSNQGTRRELYSVSVSNQLTKDDN